jgi:hypothetical protein
MCLFILIQDFLFLKNRYTKKKKRLTKKKRACRESAVVGQVEDEGSAVSRGCV